MGGWDLGCWARARARVDHRRNLPRLPWLTGDAPLLLGQDPPYHRPDCPRTLRRSRFTFPHAGDPVVAPVVERGPDRTPMSNDRITRIWHLAVAVAPLVALALTLVAGRRW